MVFLAFFKSLYSFREVFVLSRKKLFWSLERFITSLQVFRYNHPFVFSMKLYLYKDMFVWNL